MADQLANSKGENQDQEPAGDDTQTNDGPGMGDAWDTTDNRRGVVPVAFKTEAAKDPICALVKIATNKDLSDGDKGTLIEFAKMRFRHRRRMAYIALGTVVASLFLVFFAAFIDGSDTTNGTKLVESLEDVWPLIAWADGFLATIVAAYYGISAWRPSS